MKLKSSCSLLVLALGTLAVPAFAQSDANSRALAVQLFDEAEALFAKGQTGEACPKYAESYRLDPQLGALVFLAECYEKNGQTASAWGSFREAADVARKRGDARADQVQARAAALEPKLSYLVIQVPEASRVPGLEVLRDGSPVTPVLWGSKAAIDPGKHQIVARAQGYEPWQGEVEITGAGSAQTLDIPKLGEASAAPGTAGATGSIAAAPPSAGSSRRIAALAVGGLGIVAIGVGGFFGLSAQSSYSDSKPLCGAKGFCQPQGTELRDSAATKALVSTIATGVGAAALVTAGVLWFTAPKTEDASKAAKGGRQPRRLAVAPSSTSWGLEVSGAF